MTIRDINELTPLAQTACRLFMAKCREAGLDIFITETYRPQSRQNELWEQGRTKPGKIVTDTMHSRHTSRRAWDIACNGPIMYDIDTLNKAGAIARSLGITWGGDWIKPVDKPHFEIGINWEAPKEDKEEVKRYNTIDEIPEWGKETIQSLIDKGCFADPKHLDLSEDMLRTFVIINRLKEG